MGVKRARFGSPAFAGPGWPSALHHRMEAPASAPDRSLLRRVYRRRAPGGAVEGGRGEEYLARLRVQIGARERGRRGRVWRRKKVSIGTCCALQ